MKKKVLLLFALLFAVASMWAQPTTRYVPCGSGTPCYATIQEAINESVDGDIIQIAAGNYTEALTVGKSLSFIGSGPASSPTTIITSTSGNIISLSATEKNFTFHNLIVEGNAANNGIYAGSTIDINSLTMEDVILRNCQVGLYLAENWPGNDPLTTTVSTLSFDNVTLINNKFIGAYIGKTVLSGTVTNSTVTDNGYSNDLPVEWQKTGLQFVNFDEASIPHVVVSNSYFSNNGTGASEIERTGLIIYTAYNGQSDAEILTVSGCTFVNHPLYAVRVKNGYERGNTSTVNGTFTNNYLDIWFNRVDGYTSSTTNVRRTHEGIKTVGTGPTYDYNTIQAANSAASPGDQIKVFPGTYNTGSYIAVNKQGLTFQGVDASGSPITSAENVVATVGPLTGGEADMVFHVIANNVTIRGLRISDLNNKAMTINGDNFTLTNCRMENQWDLSGAIYFYDATPGIKTLSNPSVQKTFSITGNVIKGWGVAITDGTGYGWPASGRVISNNTFGISTLYPGYDFYAIGFRSVNGSGWCNSPVGGVTITDNNFADMGTRGYVYFDGNVPVDGLDFEEIMKKNTFGKGAVMSFDPITGAARPQLPSDPLYNAVTRPNLVLLKNVITNEIAKAQPGDIVKVAPGTYVEAVSINKSNLTLKSTAGRELTIINNPTPSAETPGISVLKNLGTVTVDGFTVNNFRNGIVQGMSQSEGTAYIVKNSKVIPEINANGPYLRNGIQVSGNNSQVIGNFVDGAPLTADWASSGIHVVNASNVLVKSNIVNTGIADMGICVDNWSGTVNNITIEENTVISARYAGIAITGIYTEPYNDMSNVLIKNNVLKNSTAGNGIDAYYIHLTNLEVTGNEIFGNGYAGIWFETPYSQLFGDIQITENKIYGNGFGILNQTVHIVNAPFNWWGDSSGPEHTGLNPDGLGDEVSDNVSFIPWYCSEAMTNPPCFPSLEVNTVINTTTGYQYPTLAAAIAAVGDGETLFIPGSAAGTTVTIGTKTVYIIGIPGVSVLNGSSPALMVNAGSGTLSVSDIQLVTTTNDPTILVEGGNLILRNCVVTESTAGNYACLKVTGGTVDAGTLADRGANVFVVSGPGSAIDNQQTVNLPAIGNAWGDPSGPYESVRNPYGQGGAIIGSGMANVDFEPWTGPVTTISTPTICSEATSVDVPITVENFGSVGSISLTMNYNVGDLDFTGLTWNTALNAWGTADYVVNETTGKIIFSAYQLANDPETPGDEGTNPITLTDGSTLITLSFNVVTTTTTTISFTENDQGTACEYGGPGPAYNVYPDSPLEDYYIAGGVIINYLTANTIATDQTICYNGTPSVLTGSTVTGNSVTPAPVMSYQWQSSIDAGFSTPINVGTNKDYTTVPLTVDTWYRRIATSTLNGIPCSSTSSSIKITVYPQLVVGTASQNQTICYGGTPASLTAVAPTGGSSTFAYIWQVSTTNNGLDWADIGGATGMTYSPGALTVTTYYRQKQTDTYCGTNPSTVLYTNAVTITVHPQMVVGSASATQTICYGGTPATLNAIAPTGGSGSFSYNWQVSTDNTNFSDIPSATAMSYSPAALFVTTYYRQRQTDTYCGTNPTTVVYTDPVTITVHPQLIVGSASADQTICSGGTPATLNAVAPTGGSNTFAYIWQVSTTNNGLDWADIGGATGMTFSPGALTVTTYYRQKQTDTYCGTNPTTVVYTNPVTITVNARQTIRGTFNYYNVANTPLAHLVDVQLVLVSGISAGDVTTSTNPQTITGSGTYQFDNVCPSCIYRIVATSTHPTTGAVNTTDAAQVNYWPTALYTIENGRFYAGDVKANNNFLNAQDAQLIQKNFVLGTGFDRPGGWSFWKVGETPITSNVGQPSQPVPTVTLGVGAELVQNMYALALGDFNRSFDPSGAKAASSTLDLVYTGNQQIGSNQEFDLPVRMVNGSEVGAVSLILNFPADMVEVQDVVMEGAGGMLDWAVKGDELRIGWMSQTPLNLTASADLVTLRLKTTVAFTLGKEIRIKLASDPLNELANGTYDVIGDAVLGIDVIEASTQGTPEPGPSSNALSLSAYPNPFKSFTTINYTLPFDGQVTLEVYNFLGMKVQKLVSEEQTAGDHVVKFNTAGMESGVFTATLTLKSNDNQLFRTIKLINNK